MLFILLFLCGGGLFTAARDVGGVLGVVLFVLGIIVLLKSLIFLRARTAEAVLAWWRDRPLWFYRVSALGMIAAGVELHWAT